MWYYSCFSVEERVTFPGNMHISFEDMHLWLLET